VHRYLQDADAADEIVQASFVKAYASLARFRGAASFKTWIHQIALNECRLRVRRLKSRREVPLDCVETSFLQSDGDAPNDAFFRVRLQRLIGRLPDRQRAVLTLRVFSDLAFKEISRVEGISENSAKVNYHHAIKRLRQWLSEETS
jgi:RNA polymerase sigma-70 factor (ECF subfamily)